MKKLVVTACLFLSAYAGGTMSGLVRGSGDMISIAYKQDMQHDNLQVTMPDGETFTGKAVNVGHSTGIGTGFDSDGDSSSIVMNQYTGSVQAVLFGDKGSSMRCKFQYADSSGYTPAGGIGICKTSDGRIVDVQW